MARGNKVNFNDNIGGGRQGRMRGMSLNLSVKMRCRDIRVFFRGKKSWLECVFGFIRGDFKTFWV